MDACPSQNEARALCRARDGAQVPLHRPQTWHAVAGSEWVEMIRGAALYVDEEQCCCYVHGGSVVKQRGNLSRVLYRVGFDCTMLRQSLPHEMCTGSPHSHARNVLCPGRTDADTRTESQGIVPTTAAPLTMPLPARAAQRASSSSSSLLHGCLLEALRKAAVCEELTRPMSGYDRDGAGFPATSATAQTCPAISRNSNSNAYDNDATDQNDGVTRSGANDECAFHDMFQQAPSSWASTPGVCVPDALPDRGEIADTGLANCPNRSPALRDHVLFRHGAYLVLHGGRDEHGVVQNGLLTFHLQARRWEELHQFMGGCASPRCYGHAVTAMDVERGVYVTIGAECDPYGLLKATAGYNKRGRCVAVETKRIRRRVGGWSKSKQQQQQFQHNKNADEDGDYDHAEYPGYCDKAGQQPGVFARGGWTSDTGAVSSNEQQSMLSVFTVNMNNFHQGWRRMRATGGGNGAEGLGMRRYFALSACYEHGKGADATRALRHTCPDNSCDSTYTDMDCTGSDGSSRVAVAVYLVGGQRGQQELHDVWQLTLASGVWREVRVGEQHVPTTRLSHMRPATATAAATASSANELLLSPTSCAERVCGDNSPRHTLRTREEPEDDKDDASFLRECLRSSGTKPSSDCASFPTLRLVPRCRVAQASSSRLASMTAGEGQSIAKAACPSDANSPCTSSSTASCSSSSSDLLHENEKEVNRDAPWRDRSNDDAANIASSDSGTMQTVVADGSGAENGVHDSVPCNKRDALVGAVYSCKGCDAEKSLQDGLVLLCMPSRVRARKRFRVPPRHTPALYQLTPATIRTLPTGRDEHHAAQVPCPSSRRYNALGEAVRGCEDETMGSTCTLTLQRSYRLPSAVPLHVGAMTFFVLELCMGAGGDDAVDTEGPCVVCFLCRVARNGRMHVALIEA